jgi:hypothetical protein
MAFNLPTTKIQVFILYINKILFSFHVSSIRSAWANLISNLATATLWWQQSRQRVRLGHTSRGVDAEPYFQYKRLLVNNITVYLHIFTDIHSYLKRKKERKNDIRCPSYYSNYYYIYVNGLWADQRAWYLTTFFLCFLFFSPFHSSTSDMVR